MPKELIRRIPVKRLRPGLDPNDAEVCVYRLWASDSPYANSGNDASTLLDEVSADSVTSRLERMEDVEGQFGPESVFEDLAGCCYVIANAFDRAREPGTPPGFLRGPSSLRGG